MTLRSQVLTTCPRAYPDPCPVPGASVPGWPRTCGYVETGWILHKVRWYLILGIQALAPRPWVRLVVDLGQVLEVKVGVDLGGADVGVTQEFLHGAQVAGGFQ